MSTNKNRILSVTVYLLLCSFLIGHLCFFLLPNVFNTSNAQTVDQLFKLRSSLSGFSPPYDGTIVHVDINDSTLNKMGDYYLNRSHHAHLAQNLSKMNVSAQSFDFIFAARTNDLEDKAFLDAVEKANNVYLGLAFELNKEGMRKLEDEHISNNINYLERTSWNVLVDEDPSDFDIGTHPLMTFYDLASVSRGLGYLNINIDPDGVIRRLPLLVRYKDEFYPSFSLRIICNYLDVPPEKITVIPGRSIELKGATRPGAKGSHDIKIPIDRKGRMVINFVGTWERMTHYNYADVLKASGDRDEFELWTEELSGKIVVVSEVLTGSSHLGTVPSDIHYPLSGVHANVMNNILAGTFLRELSFGKMVIIELLLLFIVFVLSYRFSSLYFSIGSIGLAFLYLFFTGGCFLYANLILNIIRPFLILAFAIATILIYRYVNEEKAKLEGLRQRDFIRSTFGRYLSNEVVEELLDSPQGLKMKGELREVTFLVSDLRGFTALSEGLPPNSVIPILNLYFEAMVETIASYHGTVDELQGDGILAFFGAPIYAHDDPDRAVACAIAMQNKMHELNDMYRTQDMPELSMGIGIHTGEVIVGNIGSEKRSKYGAVGSAINQTFRIESYTTGGQILISDRTFEKVRRNVQINGSIKVAFKGVNQVVTLYNVTGMRASHHVSLLPKSTDTLIPLKSTLSIMAYPIEGKIVSEKGIPGHILCLGTSTAEVTLKGPVDTYTNLKICFTNPVNFGRSDIYAKVLSPDTGPSITAGSVRLAFTGIDKETLSFLEMKRAEMEETSN